MLTKPMPSFKAVYAFLKAHYRTDRFEGRNGAWCPNYSEIIAQSTMDDLEQNGHSLIGHYEAACGRVIEFDRSLKAKLTYVDMARDRMMQADRDEPASDGR